MDELETEHWHAEELDESQLHLIERFQRATARGFHDPVCDDTAVQKWTDVTIARKMRMSMVYDRTAKQPSRHATEPVHTYGAFPGLLNVGGAQPVAIHKITAVTVSPTHRRRGILGRQIRQDLQYAADRGFALAALTASEGSIYGRWGFGVASYQNKFVLDSEGGVQLRHPVPGTVEDLAIEHFQDEFDQLAERCLAVNFGSVDAAPYDRGYFLGQWEGWETMSAPKDARFAIYRSPDGQIDGLLSYKFKGWKQDTAGMVVRGVITVSAHARVALLAYLGNHDLIEEVHGTGPIQDPLSLAVANERDYKITERKDVLWLRILDPVKALSRRGWSRDARMCLQIEDELGYAAGTFEVDIQDGVAQVSTVQLPDTTLPILQMDNAVLARLYLGAAKLADLAALGLVQCAGPRQLQELAMVFEQPQSAFTPYEF